MVLTLLGGLGLRILHLGEWSFHHDEAVSVAIARLDWRSWAEVITKREANSALYFALLHGWLRWGDSEIAVRSFSVLWSAATLPLIYLLGTRLFSARVGLIAAFLMSCNAFHIHYAQDGRGYSLLLFLVTLSSLLFVRAIERPSAGRWAAYALTTALAVYSHLFGILPLPVHWMSLISLRRRAAHWRGLAWSTLATNLLVFPLGIFALTRNVGQINWIPKPGARDVARLFSALAGGGGDPLLMATLTCVFWAVIAGRRNRKSMPSEGSYERWSVEFLLGWLVIPVLYALGVSILKPIFLDRYLIICLSPLVLLAAYGVSKLPWAWLRGMALLVLAGLSFRGIDFYYHRQTRYQRLDVEDWRGAAQYVLSEARADDALIFYHTFGRIPFDYYQNRFKKPGEQPVSEFPETTSTLALLGEEGMSPEVAQALVPAYPRIWLVLYPGSDVTARHPIRALLASDSRTVEERQFSGVRVILFKTRRP